MSVSGHFVGKVLSAHSTGKLKKLIILEFHDSKSFSELSILAILEPMPQSS